MLRQKWNDLGFRNGSVKMKLWAPSNHSTFTHFSASRVRPTAQGGKKRSNSELQGQPPQRQRAVQHRRPKQRLQRKRRPQRQQKLRRWGHPFGMMGGWWQNDGEIQNAAVLTESAADSCCSFFIREVGDSTTTKSLQGQQSKIPLTTLTQNPACEGKL